MGDLVITETFTVIHCGGCGVSFAVASSFDQERRRDHKTFHCPNGCKRYYPRESDIEKASRQAREAQKKAERLQECIDHKKHVIRQKDYQIRNYKGQVTKLKKKIGGNT